MIKGDFSKLSKLIDRLGSVGNVQAAVSTESAADIDFLVEHQYAQGIDPYGNPWEPLRPSTIASGRTNPPLTASGKMRANSRAVAGVAGVQGVTVTVSRPGGNPNVPNFHQHGTVKMAERQILPEQSGPLPDAWRGVITVNVTKELTNHFNIGGG